MRAAVAVVLGMAATGCIPDDYECHQDSDCNLDTGGRCDLTTHHCTDFDLSCPTAQRYTPHSEQLSGTCFDGRAMPLDLCAPGQPPAPREGCAAKVCNSLAACCDTGWSEACVLEAQQVCMELVCDTRIAITAQRGMNVALWDLRYDGVSWTAIERSDRLPLLSWLAPAPGFVEPRLAGFAQPSTLVIETESEPELDIAVAPTFQYHDIASLDLDRDLRDTAVLSFQDLTTNGQYVETIKLGTSAIRDLEVGVSQRQSWGDYDHDAFPDGVAATTGGRYTLLVNYDPGDHVRSIDASISSSVGGLNTPNASPVRGFSWFDLDRDGWLDLVEFGSQLRVHAGDDRIRDTPLVTIDCDPPVTLSDHPGCDMTASADAAFSGTVVPSISRPTIVAATYPTRALYQITTPGVTNLADIVSLTLPAVICPVSTCAFQAVITRDLDGDHQLDLVAIDSTLDLFVALSSNGMKLEEHKVIVPQAIPTPAGYTSVHTSVTGAVRP